MAKAKKTTSSTQKSTDVTKKAVEKELVEVELNQQEKEILEKATQKAIMATQMAQAYQERLSEVYVLLGIRYCKAGSLEIRGGKLFGEPLS